MKHLQGALDVCQADCAVRRTSDNATSCPIGNKLRRKYISCVPCPHACTKLIRLLFAQSLGPIDDDKTVIRPSQKARPLWRRAVGSVRYCERRTEAKHDLLPQLLLLRNMTAINRHMR